MKKYKLLKDEWGFHRIQALKNFNNVQEGDLGGFIESESNLSHDGNCWIYDDALVCGKAKVFWNAKVSGNARVCGKAKVFWNAKVSGNAEVFGNAKVCGNAQVFGRAKVYGNARVCGNGEVSENSRIYDNAEVYKDAKVYGNGEVFGKANIIEGIITKKAKSFILSKDVITIQPTGRIKIGCELHTIEHWLENYKTIGEYNNYSEEKIKEYYIILKAIDEMLKIL